MLAQNETVGIKSINGGQIYVSRVVVIYSISFISFWSKFVFRCCCSPHLLSLFDYFILLSIENPHRNVLKTHSYRSRRNKPTATIQMKSPLFMFFKLLNIFISCFKWRFVCEDFIWIRMMPIRFLRVYEFSVLCKPLKRCKTNYKPDQIENLKEEENYKLLTNRSCAINKPSI